MGGKKGADNEDGFYLLSKRMPEEFDLVVLKDKNGKTAPGWWQKDHFEGKNIEYLDEIIKWKRYTHL